MNLVRIGNRIFNPDCIVAASFIPSFATPDMKAAKAKCIVSLGRDEPEIFYDGDAAHVWAYLCKLDHCRNLTEPEPETEPLQSSKKTFWAGNDGGNVA